MNQHLTLVQEGPINTLALNKDCNKVVVTGRNSNHYYNSFYTFLTTHCLHQFLYSVLLQYFVFVRLKILVLWRGIAFPLFSWKLDLIFFLIVFLETTLELGRIQT